MSASLHLPNGPTIRVDIEGTSAAVIAAASTLPTATLHEAGGRIGVMPSAIKPVSPTFRLCGPAVTVSRNSRRMSGVIFTRSSRGSVGGSLTGCDPGVSRMKNIGTSSSLYSFTRWPLRVTSSSSFSAPSPKT